MKHTIEVSKEITETLEIEFPKFYKSYHDVYAIIDADNVYNIFHMNDLTIIQNGTLDTMKNAVAFAIKHDEISEAEFFAAYEKARKATELNPVLEYYSTGNGIAIKKTLK
jgi:hypothetical protein